MRSVLGGLLSFLLLEVSLAVYAIKLHDCVHVSVCECVCVHVFVCEYTCVCVRVYVCVN